MIPLGEILWAFALMSLLAFGGGNAALPEMHRVLVDERHWLTDADFTELFALAQAAPGPNILVVSLIGLRLAGVLGFLLATLAFCLPSSLLMYGIAHWWLQARNAAWRAVVQPVAGALATGLVLAGGGLMVVTAAAGTGGLLWVVFAATVVLVLTLPWNPLWWIVIGAALGLAGLI
jgi:chromate transporter